METHVFDFCLGSTHGAHKKTKVVEMSPATEHVRRKGSQKGTQREPKGFERIPHRPKGNHECTDKVPKTGVGSQKGSQKGGKGPKMCQTDTRKKNQKGTKKGSRKEANKNPKSTESDVRAEPFKFFFVFRWAGRF